MRRLPAHAIGRHRGQLQRAQSQRRIGARHSYGFPGHARYVSRRDQRRCGKAPGAIDDDAHAEAERAAIGHHRHFERLARSALGVEPHGKELLAVADNAYVGVGSFELLRFAEGGGAQVFEFGVRRGGTYRGGKQAPGQGRGSAGLEKTAPSEHAVHRASISPLGAS